MRLARSKITPQGKVSIPAKVRRRLGVGPGSTLVWDEEGGQVVIRRAGGYTSEEIHRALFPDGPPTSHSLEDLKDGIRKAIRQKHEVR